MDITADELAQAIRHLRHAHSEVLVPMPQANVIAALAEFAVRWRDPAYGPRRLAEATLEPFPFAMVKVSLDALLDSLTPDKLWQLVDSEEVRNAKGHPLIGHVIAGNTPLLGWVSIIRALLVGSASLVKLPSGPASAWGHLFQQSLADVSPELAECVFMAQWPGGTAILDAALCGGADLVMAHGGDDTLHALKALCPAGTPFVGYGHRVSFGLVLPGGATAEAAAGFARDVLLYDQGGCLSPQTIFVEDGWQQATGFAMLLADALVLAARQFPLPVRAARAAMTVREARLLAHMEDETRVWEDPAGRWTVAARPQQIFVPSPTFGIVSVQALDTLADLPEAVSPVAAFLQGCAVAGEAQDYLPALSRVCAPGELQAPPLSWRQDGRDVLRVLVRWAFTAPTAAR